MNKPNHTQKVLHCLYFVLVLMSCTRLTRGGSGPDPVRKNPHFFRAGLFPLIKSGPDFFRTHNQSVFTCSPIVIQKNVPAFFAPVGNLAAMEPAYCLVKNAFDEGRSQALIFIIRIALRRMLKIKNKQTRRRKVC